MLWTIPRAGCVRVVGRLGRAVQNALERLGLRLRIAEIQPEYLHAIDRVQKRDRLRVVLVDLLVGESGEREFFKLSSVLGAILKKQKEPLVVGEADVKAALVDAGLH